MIILVLSIYGNKPCRNTKKGDVVLIKVDSASRKVWILGLVVDTENDQHGDVCAVTVNTQNHN